MSFGLVNIPVKVYPATEDRDFKFRYLHRACFTPITYVKRCPTCGVDVNQQDIVRGYEYARGQFVTINGEELQNLPLPTTRAIEIADFVNLDEIDPLYFSHPYYLVPGDGGQKPYSLLHRAMGQTGKAALAKVALRQKESLVAIRLYRQVLVMETMAYQNEIRQLEGMPEAQYQEQLDPRELDMAVRLVDSLTTSFDIGKYNDNYHQALEQLISNKISGRDIAVSPTPNPAKVVDLMDALKASIERAQSERSPIEAGRPAKRRAAAGKASGARTAAKAVDKRLADQT